MITPFVPRELLCIGSTAGPGAKSSECSRVADREAFAVLAAAVTVGSSPTVPTGALTGELANSSCGAGLLTDACGGEAGSELTVMARSSEAKPMAKTTTPNTTPQAESSERRELVRLTRVAGFGELEGVG